MWERGIRGVRVPIIIEFSEEFFVVYRIFQEFTRRLMVLGPIARNRNILDYVFDFAYSCACRRWRCMLNSDICWCNASMQVQ